MSIRKMLTGAVVGASVMVVAAAPGAAWAEPQTYQYSFQEHHASDSFLGEGVCAPGAATVHLLDYNEAIHVSDTLSGLTQAQVETAIESESDRTITKLTYTQTGSVAILDASGISYAGRFTLWFGGSVSNHTMAFSGTFSISVTGSDGSHISEHSVGHVTLVNGEPVVDFHQDSTQGCPA